MKQVETKLEMKATAALAQQVEADLKQADKPLDKILEQKQKDEQNTK